MILIIQSPSPNIILTIIVSSHCCHSRHHHLLTITVLPPALVYAPSPCYLHHPPHHEQRLTTPPSPSPSRPHRAIFTMPASPSSGLRVCLITLPGARPAWVTCHRPNAGKLKIPKIFRLWLFMEPLKVFLL